MTPMAPAPFPVQPAPLEDQLVRQWTGFAYTIAGDYFLPGSDIDDLHQEALIGLLEGLRAFDPARGVPLIQFLGLTIRRKVITAVKTASRGKRRYLTHALREIPLDDEIIDAVNVFPDPLADPHRLVIDRLELREALDGLRLMSDAERRAVVGFAIGITYEELNQRPVFDKAAIGAVDNAYARGRKKLRDAA